MFFSQVIGSPLAEVVLQVEPGNERVGWAVW
jgi:hypothetical protein